MYNIFVFQYVEKIDVGRERKIEEKDGREGLKVSYCRFMGFY